MTPSRRPSRAPRPGFAAALALTAALALGLASCGTVPPEPGATGTAPTGSPRATARASTPASPGATPTPAATSASPSRAASPTPTPSARPTKAPPAPPPDSWAGTFQGHQVFVPHGHGATMSFTFDDGPWPGSTAQVLALLQQHHVHAVFCVIGIQARAYPSLVRREVAGGHELCDHSRDHDLTMNKKGKHYVDAEVGDGLADVVRAAPRGTRVRFYRQPGGLWTPTVVRSMKRRGLDPLRWSDDPRDWSRPGSLVIVRRVVARLHPGVVVLMHDGGGDRSQTVAALRFLLDAVVKAGWKPVLAPHVVLSDKAAATPQ